MKKSVLSLTENCNFILAEESECFYFDDEISLSLTLNGKKIWLEQDSKSYEFTNRFNPLFTITEGEEYTLFLGHGCHVSVIKQLNNIQFTIQSEEERQAFPLDLSTWKNWLDDLHDFFS